MADDIPRTASWKGDVPSGACCDDFGEFDIREPLDVLFNVIPRHAPTQEVVEYLKNNRGLKAWAMCSASHVGTVSTVVSRQISLQLSDDVVARLLESLKCEPDGFVVFDLGKTELFSNTAMWNAATSDAPEISHKWLYLGLCYSFQHAAEILDEAIQKNFENRHKRGLIATALAPLTLGFIFFCNNTEKYKLMNKKKFPRDVTLSHKSYGGIVLTE